MNNNFNVDELFVDAKLSITIKADADSEVLCDGEIITELKANIPQKVFMAKGPHILTFISSKKKNIVIERKVNFHDDDSHIIEIDEFNALLNPTKEKSIECETGDSSDIMLKWISNGNDCNKRSNLFMETEIPITAKSQVFIKFNAAKWDGVVAGFIHYPPKGYYIQFEQDGATYNFLCWELLMNKHQLYFHFPIIQKNHIDLGTFLPNKEYIVQTVNPMLFPCKTIKRNLIDELRAFKIIAKIKAAGGYQGIPDNYNLNDTITLCKIANEYAWEGLKIYHFRVCENKVPVADMIPVLHKDTPCFYDKVRQRYFYFEGKGTLCWEAL